MAILIQMKSIKLLVTVGVINLLISLYYLIVGIRLSSLYSDFNVSHPNPILNNPPLLIFTIITITTFLAIAILKILSDKYITIHQSLIFFLVFFFSLPWLYLLLQLTYSLTLTNILL